MKNYFKFNLTGNKVLPVWIVFMVLFLIPYIFVQYKLQGFKTQSHDPQEVMSRLGEMLQLYGLMFFLILVEYTILFFLAKLAIEGVEFKEKSLTFIGKFGDYMYVLLSGFLLSIITLGIYSPWFMAKMINFFAKNTHYETDNLEFKSKGGDLFVLVLITLIIPMIIVMSGIGIFAFAMKINGSSPTETHSPMAFIYGLIMALCIFIIVIPFMYNYYKWFVNFNYKNYSIKWETSFWSSVGVILGQVCLSIITAGIYAPLAYLKLFKYFSGKTIARSETSAKKFGYDLEPASDFLYIWGQILLTIITLGIYYPWGFCKIADRVLGKSYLEEIEIVTTTL